MLNTGSETMNGGPYIYDPESKKFVMRPAAEPERKPLTNLPDPADEPSLPAPKVRPPPPRERQKVIVRVVSLVLFLAWLILLTVWTRKLSSRIQAPGASSSSLPSEFPKEMFPK
jgi:hypothetical protein